MFPEVDLIEVAKLCAALLMLAVTLGICGLIGVAIMAAIRGQGDE